MNLIVSNLLKNKAKDVLDKFGKTLPEDNILYNNIAQLIEIVYAIEHSIEICNTLISEGITEEKVPDIKVKASSGTGAIEAPRGTLYHSYSIDNDGYITDADVITPTA